MRKILLFCCLLVATSSFSQLVWEKVDLPHRNGALFTSPRNIIYTPKKGTTNIIYRSYDEGVTWDSLIVPFKSSKPIFAIDSLGVIYGLTDDSLMLSADDGATWEMRPLPNITQGQFMEAARDSLYYFAVGQGNGPWAYVSSDQGQSWEGPRKSASNGADVYWFGSQASPQGNVFGFLGHDGSAHLIGGSSAPRTIMTWLSSISFDQEGRGYANHGTDIASPPEDYLLTSTDGGLSWMTIDSASGSRKRYWPPYGAPRTGGIIAVSDTETVVSYDQTDTWVDIGPGLPVGYSRTFVTTKRGTIFVDSDKGLFRTSHFAAVKRGSSTSGATIGFDPVSKMLSVNEFETGSSLIITDIVGRIAMQEMLRDQEEYRIDLSGLGSGTYMAAVVSGSSSKSTMLSISR